MGYDEVAAIRGRLLVPIAILSADFRAVNFQPGVAGWRLRRLHYNDITADVIVAIYL